MPSILYVHTQIESPGGANRMVIETANRLSEVEDFDITIATSHLNKDIYTLDSSVDLYEFGGGSPSQLLHWVQLPNIIKELARLIKNKKIESVMFHSIPTVYWTIPLKKMVPGTSFIWYAHDPNAYLNLPGKIKDVPYPMRALLILGHPVLRKFDTHVIPTYIDQIIANSEFTNDVISEVYNIESTVIPPGIDTTQFKPKRRDKETIFTVGQLNKYNNFEQLIEAMAILNRKMNNPPNLVVAGTGNYQSDLIRLSKELGIQDLVKFVGYLTEPELIEQYSGALVTVYLPEMEPFGLVPVESMSCRTPVIARDSGGIRETVIDGQTGILLQKLTAERVADALYTLITNPEKREVMGDMAYDRMNSHFSIEQMVEGLRSELIKYTDSP